jgi:hypothetical protein
MPNTPTTVQFSQRERGKVALIGTTSVAQLERNPHPAPCPELRGPKITAVTIIDTAAIADQEMVTTAINGIRSALETLKTESKG